MGISHPKLSITLRRTDRLSTMGSTVTQTEGEPVTADNVSRLFPDVNTSLASSHKVPTSDSDLQGYDEEQIRLMEEVLIVLDADDVPIGSASKKVCLWIQSFNDVR